MSEEIKEILQDVIDDIYQCGEYIGQAKKLEKVLNYITNLQKENEKLHKQVTEYQDEIFARDNNWYDMQD